MNGDRSIGSQELQYFQISHPDICLAYHDYAMVLLHMILKIYATYNKILKGKTSNMIDQSLMVKISPRNDSYLTLRTKRCINKK